MKRVVVSLLLLASFMVVGTSCGKKTASSKWKAVLKDYEVLVDKSIELYKVQGTEDQAKVEAEIEALAKKMEAKGKEMEAMVESLSPIEQMQFAIEFAKVTAKMLEDKADEIEEITKDAAEKAKAELEKADITE